MAVRLFEGKEHAALYWKYRISPSAQMIEEVVAFVQNKKALPFDLAVDVGCGSGQGTILLAPYFSCVEGTDVSPAQLVLAQEHASAPNISYRQCPAEELPMADSSVDLVTAMSAFHWFDHARFLQEAHRVLKPGGGLALLNYTMDMELHYGDRCSHTLSLVCREFYAALLPYRNPHLGPSSVALYKQTYTSIPYTQKEWQECVWVKKLMPLSSYIGMVESFSSYQALLKKDPGEARTLSDRITNKLLTAMGVSSSETEVVVGVRYFYLLACKPVDDS